MQALCKLPALPAISHFTLNPDASQCVGSVDEHEVLYPKLSGQSRHTLRKAR